MYKERYNLHSKKVPAVLLRKIFKIPENSTYLHLAHMSDTDSDRGPHTLNVLLSGPSHSSSNNCPT